MPAFIFTGNYHPMSGWQWFTDKLDIADEGWKLHVSGNQIHAQTILYKVLPVLQAFMVGHKFLPTTEALELQNKDSMQAGKFLAIYPDNIVQAFIIVSEIDKVLDGVVGHQNVPLIHKEKWIGRTVIYTRYGAYNNFLHNPTEDRYVNDTRGEMRPPWIEDPWGLYSASPNFRELRNYASWPRHSKVGHRK